MFQEWNQRFLINLVKNQMVFLSELEDYLAALHEGHGPNVYMTEADLKLGIGGLVDLAALHSCLRATTGRNDPPIRPVGGLVPRDWQRLEQARKYLILVRNHLHFVEGRRHDSLRRERFHEVAKFMAGSTDETKLAAEFLVRDTVRHRRQVHQIVSRFLRRATHEVNAKTDDAKVRYLKLTTPASIDLLDGKETSGTPER